MVKNGNELVHLLLDWFHDGMKSNFYALMTLICFNNDPHTTMSWSRWFDNIGWMLEFYRCDKLIILLLYCSLNTDEGSFQAPAVDLKPHWPLDKMNLLTHPKVDLPAIPIFPKNLNPDIGNLFNFVLICNPSVNYSCKPPKILTERK